MAEPSLHTLFSSRFPHPVHTDKPHLLALSSAHDLVAAVTHEHDIDVYRLGGQRVFSVKRVAPDAEVTALRWKADGARLAVGWSNGMDVLFDGERGRVVSRSAPEGREGAAVRCLGWCRHVAELAQASGPGLSDALLDADGSDADGIASTTMLHDLPRALSTLAVDAVLPRLSAIPAHVTAQFGKGGTESSRFATQAAVDGVFHATAPDAQGSLDLLLVCGGMGAVDMLLDEDVAIGRQHLPDGHTPIGHVAHPFSSTHVILSESRELPLLRLNYIQAPLATLSSPLLHVVALRTKQLHNLLDYVTATLRCAQHDFTAGRKFPLQWIENINETLAEKQEGDLVANLFALTMTGNFTPTVLEWLVDIIREQNHKRWDEKTNSMYAHIKHHISINLLPALDRIVIAAAALRGHATFHEGSGRFDIPPRLFTSIIETVHSIRLVAHRVLLVCMAEHQQFRAFSKWLRVQIDIGAAGPGSKSALETEEREVPNIEYHHVLGYIRSAMTQSQLAFHFDIASGERLTDGMRQDVLPEDVDAALKACQMLGAPGQNVRRKDESNVETFVNLDVLGAQLGRQGQRVSETITKWHSRMLIPPTHVDIETVEMSEVRDLRMIVRGTLSTTLVALGSKALPYELILHAIPHPQTDTLQLSRTVYHLAGGEILDLKFIADEALLVLYHSRDDGQDAGYALLRLHLDAGDDRQAAVQQLDWRDIALHRFLPEERFVPVKMLAGGRLAKKVFVVFGRDGRSWKVFDLDHKPDVKPVGEEDEWEDESMEVDS